MHFTIGGLAKMSTQTNYHNRKK